MFIVTAKVPKRRNLAFAAIAVLVIAAAAVALTGHSPKSAENEPSFQAETNEQRVAYLESLGWEVDAEPVESPKQTTWTMLPMSAEMFVTVSEYVTTLSLWNTVCSVSVKEAFPVKRCPCQEVGNDAAQTTVSTCCVVFRCTKTV